MNEILVEEENTVYELDPECLKRKEEQKKREEQRKGHETKTIQKMSQNKKQTNLWMIILILWIVCQ